MILDDLIIKYFPSMNIPILKKHQMMLNNVSLNVKEGAGGRNTAIAYKIDGTYYDLSKFIQL